MTYPILCTLQELYTYKVQKKKRNILEKTNSKYKCYRTVITLKSDAALKSDRHEGADDVTVTWHDAHFTLL